MLAGRIERGFRRVCSPPAIERRGDPQVAQSGCGRQVGKGMGVVSDQRHDAYAGVAQGVRSPIATLREFIDCVKGRWLPTREQIAAWYPAEAARQIR